MHGRLECSSSSGHVTPTSRVPNPAHMHCLERVASLRRTLRLRAAAAGHKQKKTPLLPQGHGGAAAPASRAAVGAQEAGHVAGLVADARLLQVSVRLRCPPAPRSCWGGDDWPSGSRALCGGGGCCCCRSASCGAHAPLCHITPVAYTPHVALATNSRRPSRLGAMHLRCGRGCGPPHVV